MSRNKLAVSCWGGGNACAPRALLVHGITASAATMWQLGQGLADAGWSVTAVDLPGHGRTGSARSYRIVDSARALAAVTSRVDVLVGHSFGGAVGVQMLADRPDVCTRAVLLDPALLVSDDELESLAQSFVDGLQVSAEQLRSAYPHWHPHTRELIVEAAAQALPEAIRASATDSRPWDLRRAAAQVMVPVHVLVASGTSAVQPGLLEGIAATNRRWTWEVVPDTSHCVHWDRPSAVLETIRAG